MGVHLITKCGHTGHDDHVDLKKLEEILRKDEIGALPHKSIAEMKEEVKKRYPWQRGTQIFRGLDERQIETVLRQVQKGGGGSNNRTSKLVVIEPS